MARAQLANNAVTTLSAAITSNTQTSITVTSAGAFPVLTGGQYFWATLLDASNNVEIVKVTATVSNVFTVVRGQDNTTARSSFSIGTKVSLNPTAAVLNELAPLDAPTFTSGATVSTGNFALSGSAQRYVADFSNGTLSSRAMYQTNASNSATYISSLPSGSGGAGGFTSFNGTDPANSAYGGFYIDASYTYFISAKNGSGTYVPAVFYTGGSERFRIDTGGGFGLGGANFGTAGQFMVTNGANSSPVWSNALPTNTTVGAYNVGTKEIPINSQNAGYTLVLADSGKSIYMATAGTFTIPANASVAFPIGTAITFVNITGSACSIAITTDTMYLGGQGLTGTRSLANYGCATAIKVAATTWLISGAGLT